MLLTADVGNSQTVLGLFREAELVRDWRIATESHRSADELAVVVEGLLRLEDLSPGHVERFAMASVVPALIWEYRKMCERYLELEPLVVGPGVKTGMPVKTSNPDEVGPDLIADGVAAFDAHGGPVIVVDFGTATTVGAVSQLGEYLGTAIAPGVLTALDALVSRAARLRSVELKDPGTVIGKSTVQSLQAGVIYGFAGQVDGLVRRMDAELGGGAVTVATGGLAGLISRHTETIQHHDPYLTLRGLRIIAERNR